jgi:hypothetical protein
MKKVRCYDGHQRAKKRLREGSAALGSACAVVRVAVIAITWCWLFLGQAQ